MTYSLFVFEREKRVLLWADKKGCLCSFKRYLDILVLHVVFVSRKCYLWNPGLLQTDSSKWMTNTAYANQQQAFFSGERSNSAAAKYTCLTSCSITGKSLVQSLLSPSRASKKHTEPQKCSPHSGTSVKQNKIILT